MQEAGFQRQHLQVCLSCPSISCPPSAKVRQSLDRHESLEQEPGGHMHTDPKAGDSPWHFLPLPRPRGSHKTKATCPEGLSQPGEKPRGPGLTSPATYLSSRRQPVPSGESLGFPQTRCGPPPILFLPPGFTLQARPAEGSGQDRGALQLCTLGGRRLLIN